jgi:hypothetical protein
MILGKSIGSINISSNIDPIVIPLIFNVLNRIFLKGIFIKHMVVKQYEDKNKREVLYC